MTGEKTDLVRAVYDLTGVVQGVGFRPALYRLAREAGLSGSVQNRTGAVRLVIEGAAAEIDSFVAALPDAVPSSARIDRVTVVSEPTPISPGDLAPFAIADSHGTDEMDVVIPADLAMCEHCRGEVFDPADRRHGYAFTTCTACGPRYTVVNAMPYDRERTTMAAFPMCMRCQREYDDPADRRFHAETTACPDCGPKLSLLDATADPVPGNALHGARAALADGAIVAIRGIGGFLLACDPRNRQSLEALRKRKHRPHKPFALMADDLATIRRYCDIPAPAAELLSSAERPIAILDTHTAVADLPLDLITPDAATIGMMLPTSPLHALLFEPLHGDPTPPMDLLVMTSGNRGGEPICITNAEALDRLQGIADFFLCHNREVNLRNDDSLFALQTGAPQVWRRARGYAPRPFTLAAPLDRVVLATGAELKNTVAVGYDRNVVLSPHVGDLETPEANDGFEQVADCLPRFLDRQPEVVAVDRHPDMHSSRVGRRIADAAGIPVVEVQHHHAHALACLAEHGERRGLALVFDGTGLGTDDTIWGAELLDVDETSFRRLGTFSPVPLPGGDAAVRQPLRQLIGRWHAAGVTPSDARLCELGVTPAEAGVWQQQCERGVNAPMTHAAGRLFDAVSAALGVPPREVTYEGQAAISLEALAATCTGGNTPSLPYQKQEQDGLLTIDWNDTFRMLAGRGPVTDVDRHALALHEAIARACVDMVDFGFRCTERRIVALSGGVFMNRILTRLLVTALEKLGATALVHREVPPNDGCIALGQAVIAGRS